MALLAWIFWSIATLWFALLAYNVICLEFAPDVPRGRRIKFEAQALRFLPGKAPLVSILVPARNEAARILSESIRSMLSQDYPGFEVIAVDDRSTDGTLAILKDIAKDDNRLKVVTGQPLPDGWLGKPWALQQAKSASRGEWLLATDADVVFDAGAVSEAMSVALREGCDALSLVPDISSNGFWMRLVMPIAGWSIMMLYPYWRVNNPRSTVALGAGGFFLLRAAAHDLAGGYEAVRDQVIEDATTAKLIKRAGLRFKLAAGDSILKTPMYSGMKELFEGFGKNAFAGSGASVSRSMLLSFLNLFFTVAPLLSVLVILARSLAVGGIVPFSVFVAALAAYMAMVAAFIPVYRRAGAPSAYSIFSFAANLIMTAILLWSMWRIVTGQGVTWKSRNLYGRDTG